MQGTAFQVETTTRGERERAPRKQARRISWEAFQRRYGGKENGYKYEWVGGRVERTPSTMNPSQLFIQRNLTALFRQFLIEKKVTGELLAEPDLLLYEAHHRHPDMAWLTNAQIDRLAVEGAIEVPAFVIEVISNKDASSKVVEKMEDYRRAGVQAVWHIFPNIEQVHVYAGEGLRRMVVCKDAELCSAAPALPGFAVPVHEIFKKGTGTGE